MSLEEVFIALRDDRHLLNDPEGLLSGSWMDGIHNDAAAIDKSPTLYPDGFTLSRFMEVIERGRVALICKGKTLRS